jgi:hypothetical protein
MRVYFDATPSGIPRFSQNYIKIASLISKLGHQHTSDFITSFDPHFYKQPKSSYADHYRIIKAQIDTADLLVIEATISSTSLGLCIEYGLLQGKPLIILKTNQRNDVFLEGAGEAESKVLVIEYTLNSLESQLKDALDYFEGWMESRFTMLLSADITQYLNRLAKQGINRSEYIRTLIRKDMEQE